MERGRDGWAGGILRDKRLVSFHKLVQKGVGVVEEDSGQPLCGGGVECLHDILYHKIDRMFITDVSYLPAPHK